MLVAEVGAVSCGRLRQHEFLERIGLHPVVFQRVPYAPDDEGHRIPQSCQRLPEMPVPPEAVHLVLHGVHLYPHPLVMPRREAQARQCVPVRECRTSRLSLRLPLRNHRQPLRVPHLQLIVREVPLQVKRRSRMRCRRPRRVPQALRCQLHELLCQPRIPLPEMEKPLVRYRLPPPFHCHVRVAHRLVNPPAVRQFHPQRVSRLQRLLHEHRLPVPRERRRLPSASHLLHLQSRVQVKHHPLHLLPRRVHHRQLAPSLQAFPRERHRQPVLCHVYLPLARIAVIHLPVGCRPRLRLPVMPHVPATHPRRHGKAQAPRHGITRLPPSVGQPPECCRAQQDKPRACHEPHPPLQQVHPAFRQPRHVRPHRGHLLPEQVQHPVPRLLQIEVQQPQDAQQHHQRQCPRLHRMVHCQRQPQHEHEARQRQRQRVPHVSRKAERRLCHCHVQEQRHRQHHGEHHPEHPERPCHLPPHILPVPHRAGENHLQRIHLSPPCRNPSREEHHHHRLHHRCQPRREEGHLPAQRRKAPMAYPRYRQRRAEDRY